MAVCFDSIKICALRVTLLDLVGNVAAGPNNFVSTNRETKFGWTSDTDAGKDLFYRNGCDAALASYKSPTLLKRFTTAVDLFGLEPAVQSLMLGASIIDDDAAAPVGFEYNIQSCPADALPPNVAVEAWSYAINCDAQDGTTPYWYYLFPLTQWQSAGENALQTDFLQPAMAGFTRKNPLWGHGPYGGIHAGTGAEYLNLGAPAVMLTDTAPPAAICGFGTVEPAS